MPFIGSVPEEFSLSALVNKLTGRGKVFDYYLEFERMKENVSVKFKIEKPVEKFCTGLLNIKSSGNDACTVTATISAIGCKEKEWKITDDESIKCNGIVYDDVYTEECTWTIKPAGEDEVFVYELYIDEKIKDSKSVKCSISGPEPTECSPDKLVKNVDKTLMLKNIEYLTQHSREYKSSGNKKTADYIKNKLEEYGLSNVHFEDFNSGDGRNVIGEIGSGETTIIVTGGHRDAVTSCPGAVDNAAGTATVLETARVISNCKDSIKEYKIVFVLFDGEELGLLGSNAYVNSHSSENTKGMINLDCLGHKDAKSLRIFRSSFSTPLSNSADKACQFLEKSGMGTCKRSGSVGSSDHVPFDDSGVDWIFAGNDISSTGDLGKDVCGACYHCMSCEDDITQIDASRLEWSGKFTTYVISDLYIK